MKTLILKITLFSFLVCILNPHKAQAQHGVALVLCGGGAKGFAHIGVLKVLDSLHIPIDYIGGTSMGAIIGSMYALGYSGKEIEKIARQTNWEELFSDEADRNLIPFYEKNMMERYIATFKIKENGIQLPQGFINGQKILNFLNEITINAHSFNDFTQFKIPFYCIATDISEGKDVILDKGFITTALRASMSIPTAFSPFERNNRLFIDGGIINNFPIDVMKERFQGKIIGVDIQKGLLERKDIESFTSVLNQLSTIMDLHRFNYNKSLCDIYIHPDIAGYSTMSFSKEAVDTLIKRGEKAALQMLPELMAYACSDIDSSRIQNTTLDSIRKKTFTVKDIHITGQKRNSSLYIKQKLGIETGKAFTLDKLKLGINSLYASNEYDFISYRFIEPDVLEIFCKERIINSIGVGVNYYEGTSATVLLNYTHKNMLFNGDLFSIDVKMSDMPGMKSMFVLDKGTTPAPLLKFQINQLGLDFYEKGRHKGDAMLNFAQLELGLNATVKNLYSIGLTCNAELYDIYDFVYASDYNPGIKKSESKLFYNYKLYSMIDSRNSSILPTKGSKFYACIKIQTDNFLTYKDALPLLSGFIKNEGIINLNKNIALLHTQAARIYVTDSMPHILQSTFLGGVYQPDLYEYQFPFYGLRFAEIITKNMMMTGFDIRCRIYKKNYVSFLINGASVSDYVIFKDKTKYIIGGGINYTYYSLLGPLKYTLSYSNASKAILSYISLGYIF